MSISLGLVFTLAMSGVILTSLYAISLFFEQQENKSINYSFFHLLKKSNKST